MLTATQHHSLQSGYLGTRTNVTLESEYYFGREIIARCIIFVPSGIILH